MRKLAKLTLSLTVSVLVFAVPVWGQGEPCSECGPGAHWIDGCLAGQDLIANNGAVVGIDINPLDCLSDMSLVLDMPCGMLTVDRSEPRDTSMNFPNVGDLDGHLDVIDTEIVSMCLTDGNIFLRAGLGEGMIVQRSLGAILERSGDPGAGFSFFDVFFEVDLGGGMYAYNHTPLRIQVDIDCVPPVAQYIHPTGCLPLYNDPDPGEGVIVANLVSARHLVNIIVPTLSKRALILAVVLLVALGVWIATRRRRSTT